MSLRFDAETVARIRPRLMKKGHQVATLLADVLAGKDRERELNALGLKDQPGERPEEKLRRYLDLLEGKRQLLDARDDRFGRCEICGADLGVMPLVEMPWADRCRQHG